MANGGGKGATGGVRSSGGGGAGGQGKGSSGSGGGGSQGKGWGGRPSTHTGMDSGKGRSPAPGVPGHGKAP